MTEVLSGSGFQPFRMDLTALDPVQSTTWPIMDLVWVHKNVQDKILDHLNAEPLKNEP